MTNKKTKWPQYFKKPWQEWQGATWSPLQLPHSPDSSMKRCRSEFGTQRTPLCSSRLSEVLHGLHPRKPKCSQEPKQSFQNNGYLSRKQRAPSQDLKSLEIISEKCQTPRINVVQSSSFHAENIISNLQPKLSLIFRMFHLSSGMRSIWVSFQIRILYYNRR